MVSMFTRPFVCAFFFQAHATNALGSSDETCMLQNPAVTSASRSDRVSTLLEQTSLTAEEQRELADMEQMPLREDGHREPHIHASNREQGRTPAMMLETTSSVGGAVDASFEVFQKPTVWGPAAWFFLHTVALAQVDKIPAEKQERLRRFFIEDLAYLLPCPACIRSVQDHVSAMEIDEDTFSSRDSVFEFVWELHNMVNADKGTPETPFDEAVINYAQVFDQGVTDLHFETVEHVHNGEEVNDVSADNSAAEINPADYSSPDDFLAADAQTNSAEDRKLELLTRSGGQAGVTLADIFPFRLLR